MKRFLGVCLTVVFAFLFSFPAASEAFTEGGCASGECSHCHSLTRDEAVKILGTNVDNVLSVQMSPVKGLWEAVVEKDGQRWPVYIDFSKDFIVAGQIIQASSRRNVTGSRMLALNRVDVSGIPLGGAIVVGSAAAKVRIIVFDDPDCPHCARLHRTAREIVASRPDLAFYVKPFPRGNDPTTYEKALSVVCQGTVRALEDAFEGKPLPKGDCGSGAVKETIETAERLKIRSTPTMIFPDGRVVAGALDADTILTLLAEGTAPDGGSAAKKPK